MTHPPPPDITALLRDVRAGRPGAYDRVIPRVYDELRALAERYLRREDRFQTLQPTVSPSVIVKDAIGRPVPGAAVTFWATRSTDSA